MAGDHSIPVCRHPVSQLAAIMAVTGISRNQEAAFYPFRYCSQAVCRSPQRNSPEFYAFQPQTLNPACMELWQIQ